MISEPKPIPKDYGTDLSNLVGLGLVPFPLQVDELLNPRHDEHMVAAANTFLKAQGREELTKVIEANVGV